MVKKGYWKIINERLIGDIVKSTYILRNKFDPNGVRVVIGADSEEDALEIAREHGEEYDYAEETDPYCSDFW